ncbi:hydrogenase nickel incorporation protein HypB [Tropicimonas sp. TH_r6]|uniref:hydrogenase nickel incorporation protein HypB n=1 Tax=Tropicimonas sp. TH_r6 TaxID=3082085 RepID=UPI002952D0F6|nr:hydrogenase nickel incorporation protein HypB [Tropicimonas sp. TH_r6]MDV7145410.1 hydrogenase nickel incorporation protein HypB [Tropicimonas sp. TH_r6]
MCDTCGCNVTPGNRELAEGKQATQVLGNLLKVNDDQASHNRVHFNGHGVLSVNLMSSPGAGKTALLEATAELLGNDLRIGVIEGDLETENDADRIRACGVPVVQICTGTACHLDAHMVHDALHQIDLNRLDVLFVENVGNLVCPASFDLGQHRNVALLSTPEGDDKPAKYPVMFRSADLVLLTKRDLAPYMPEFDAAKAVNYVRQLGNAAPILELSAKSGEGLEGWASWLKRGVADLRENLAVPTAAGA